MFLLSIVLCNHLHCYNYVPVHVLFKNTSDCEISFLVVRDNLENYIKSVGSDTKVIGYKCDAAS